MSEIIVDGKLVDQRACNVVDFGEDLAIDVVERKGHVTVVGVGEDVDRTGVEDLFNTMVTAVDPQVFLVFSALAVAVAYGVGVESDGIAFEGVDVEIAFVTIVIREDFPFVESFSLFVE